VDVNGSNWDLGEVTISLRQLRHYGAGTGSAAFVLGHEWGHQIQHCLGIPLPGSGFEEYQADCLAGVALGAAAEAGLLTEEQVNEALRGVFWPHDTPSHGTSVTRQAALRRGLRWREFRDDPLERCFART
jgi:predicted metalloprotease